ncbi:MAG: hypothetical protein ABDI07_09150 [Candidatus Kryptonium sp.]
MFLMFLLLNTKEVLAHGVNYQVREEKAVCISFYFTPKEPMSFADIEVFSPRGNATFQKGKSDKNGLFCFLPDEAGSWKIIAKGMAEHGPHGAKVDIKVNEARSLEDFTKPLIAEYIYIFIIIGFAGWIVGFAGLYLYLRTKKYTPK